MRVTHTHMQASTFIVITSLTHLYIAHFEKFAKNRPKPAKKHQKTASGFSSESTSSQLYFFKIIQNAQEFTEIRPFKVWYNRGVWVIIFTSDLHF